MIFKSTLSSSLALALTLSKVVTALPLNISEALIDDLEARQSVTILSSATIATYKPYTRFASTAYCKPANTLAWNCGANCAANSDFIPTASGGDGGSIQYWYVGYSPSLATVIVAHQGTDTSNIEAIATDANAFLDTLRPALFPGVPSSVKVHNGFGDAHSRSAAAILSAVKSTISARGAKKVTVVGHSLGGALALLDGVYLPLQISGVTFRVITYGMPRVGNQEFANYVDSKLSLTHINNKKDLVPIVPGRFLGYHHPNGEVHITESSQWASCPGQDNTSTQCTVGDVPNVFEGSAGDHTGPYDGLNMGC